MTEQSTRDIPDMEDLYDEQISPLMAQIIAICKEHDLPFVASFQYGPEDFCSSALVPKEAAALMHEMWAAIQRSRQPAFAAYTITTTREAP